VKAFLAHPGDPILADQTVNLFFVMPGLAPDTTTRSNES
jgi:hypothetical protein